MKQSTIDSSLELLIQGYMEFLVVMFLYWDTPLMNLDNNKFNSFLVILIAWMTFGVLTLVLIYVSTKEKTELKNKEFKSYFG